jgi:hypothetical protein
MSINFQTQVLVDDEFVHMLFHLGMPNVNHEGEIMMANRFRIESVDGFSIEFFELPGKTRMEYLQEALTEIRAQRRKAPQVIGPKSTIEELLGNNPPSYLNVRTQNALYRFSEKLEECRKSPSKSPDYLDGLPTLRTVGDLTKWPKRKLLMIQDVGRKTIDYLESALEDAGYEFKDEG